MLTIAGGIIIATIFLSAPSFFIIAALSLGALALGGGLLIAFWKEIDSRIWWIICFFFVISIVSGDTSEKKK
jgi:hypothetical protein